MDQGEDLPLDEVALVAEVIVVYVGEVRREELGQVAAAEPDVDHAFGEVFGLCEGEETRVEGTRAEVGDCGGFRFAGGGVEL